MKTKYQIFISSTYEDLKEERDIVIKAILEMGHFPVGMEMFSAGDEEQWKLIKKQIDECDYYIVIVAFRYGSLDGPVSYTEKEYDYAASIGVPTLGFIIQEGVNWPATRVDKEHQKVELLNAFKSKVKKKLISFWDSRSDLYGKVSIALMKQFNTNPRTGWIRASDNVNPEALQEVSRLSKENGELRKQLNQATLHLKKGNQVRLVEVMETMQKHFKTVSFGYVESNEWLNSRDLSLLTLFNALAPDLMFCITTKDCAIMIARLFGRHPIYKFRAEWPTPRNTIKEMLLDLHVLGLIHPIAPTENGSSHDNWTLTAEGMRVVKNLRRTLMKSNTTAERNNANPDDSDDLPF